jgi:hypothetical protein
MRNTPEAVDEIRKKLDAIANEAPSIASKDWDAAVRSADQDYFGSSLRQSRGFAAVVRDGAESGGAGAGTG